MIGRVATIAVLGGAWIIAGGGLPVAIGTALAMIGTALADGDTRR